VSELEVNNISLSLKDFDLRNITFKLKKGTITGLIGANGSGKTTLIRTIMNLYQHHTGNIAIGRLNNIENSKSFKEKIGFVYDDNYFIEHLSIEQNKNVIRSFYSHWDESIFLTLLDKFSLDKTKKVKHLSKGMKTKFSLAIALSHHAEILIMDEPTSNLDPVFRLELLEFINQYNTDNPNMTVLFSSHNTADLERIADSIIYMQNGRIRFQESKDTLLTRCTIIRGHKNAFDILKGLSLIGKRYIGDNFECMTMEPSDEIFEDFEYTRYPQIRLEDIMFYLEWENKK